MEDLYYPYSAYLKQKYGQKVYKLPVNIPCSCPNRDGTKGVGGCIFCGEKGSGHELLSSFLPVTTQLRENRALIEKKYKAKKFIAYFQSFSNTYLDFDDFKRYMNEAANFPGIVELAVSTRPDCVGKNHLDFLRDLKEKTGTEVSVELGLQSSNNKTLEILNRGHTVEDFIDTAERIKTNGLSLTTHLISDLPWDTKDDVLKAARLINLTSDTLKIHSLYVEKGTVLESMYKDGLRLLSEDDFIERTILLLENLNPEIAIQRLIGRVPESDSVVANWHRSWWKVKDHLLSRMRQQETFQGKYYESN